MFTSQWVLSQNHRTIKVRKVLQDHWVQSLTKYHHVHKTIALSTMSSCFLNKHFQGWWLTFQTPYQLLCPSLDMLQHLDVFTVVSGPKLDTGFEMWPQQCVVKGDNYCPGTTGHTSFDRGQDSICPLAHLGTHWLMPSQLSNSIHRPFSLSSFSATLPHPRKLHELVVIKGWDPTLALLNLMPLALAHLFNLYKPLLKAFPSSNKSTLPPM